MQVYYLGTGFEVCARCKVAHVPTVVIIDRAGRARYTAVGCPGNQVVLQEVRLPRSAAPFACAEVIADGIRLPPE